MKVKMKSKEMARLPVLYRKVLRTFAEYSIDGKLKFKQARHILSWLFHIPKKECWKVLKELEKFGAIAIISNHFIRLKLTKAKLFVLKHISSLN